jgi:acyl-CoA thioester hydrolase
VTPPESRGTRTAYPSFRSIPTRWADNDAYGHVNNTVYYELFDTAVNGLLIAAGVLDIARSPVIGLVAETHCRYFAPVAFPDLVHAGVRVAHIGRSSVRYEIGLFRNDDDVAFAQGYFVHVYVDRAARRPVALPVEIREFLKPLVGSAVGPGGADRE